jgi:flagellar hook-basal body complex protein FliE
MRSRRHGTKTFVQTVAHCLRQILKTQEQASDLSGAFFMDEIVDVHA